MASPRFDAEIAGRALARSSFGALAALGDIKLPTCPYDSHRITDWRRRGGGPIVCGVCHPAAAGVPTEAIR